MNKIVLFIINMLFMGSSIAHAQFEFMTLPEALTKDANAIVREERHDFEVHSIGKATERYYRAVTILDETGKDYAVLTLPYSKLLKIRDIKATLLDGTGKQIRKIKSSDFVDVSASGGSFFDDVRLKGIDLSYTIYPYTVVFEYEMYYDGLLFYPMWSPQPEAGLSVEQSSFEVKLPSNLKLRYYTVNQAGKPQEKTTDGKAYRWEASMLSAYDEEPYTPQNLDAPVVITAPYEFEIEGYTGDMSSWESFGQFISKLNAGTRNLPEATKTKVQQLVADCTDDYCKIQKLYQYLQSNTRYVSIQLGIGGWKPMEAAAVDEYKYGDCKALSNYYCALLEAAGIEGYYTLIGAGEGRRLRKDFPSNQFNHAVVCVPQGKDTIWVECTSQTEALGFCGTFTGNREALMITPKGGKLVRTPTYDTNDNLQIRNTTLTIYPEGTAEAHINTRYTGIQQEEASFFAEMPQQKRRDMMYEAIGLKNFEIQEHTYARKKEKLPEVAENLKLMLPAYVGKSGKRLFVQPNVLSQWKRIPPADTLRKRDIQFFPFPFVDLDTVKMQLPAGFGVEYLPEPIQVKSTFGEYQASCIQEGETLIYTRRLHLNADIHSKGLYPELIDFCKKMNKADARKIVLVKQEP